jgi:hypothetical protein
LVCIFLIFLRFSMEFTRFCKTQTLLKLQLCSKPPRLSAGSQPCPYFADKPSEVFLTSQCSPWGRWPARLAGIRRARPRPRPEMGGERVPNPQGLDSGGRLALGGGRRRWLPRAMLRRGRGSVGAGKGRGSCVDAKSAPRAKHTAS